MTSLQPAVSWTAGFCTSLSAPLSQCVYTLMKACYGVSCFNVTLLSSPYNLGRYFIQAFCYFIHLRCYSIQDFFIVQSFVGQQCTECDHEQSSFSFCLERQDVLSHSLGGSCPDRPWAVLSGTALPLPLSGSTTLYSSLTSLVLGDSRAPASDPPPIGGGFVMASQSATLLVSSSQDCELTVALVRFAPDCTPMLLYDSLGHTTFRFTIGYCHCEVPLIIFLCNELLSSLLLQ